MNISTKIATLLLLMASSTTILADTISDEAIKQKNKEAEILKLKDISVQKIPTDFKDNFVNIELHEIVIKNTKNSMSEIDESVKSTKDQAALNSLFESMGTITSYKSYRFNNTPLYTENYFKSSSVISNSNEIKKLDNKTATKSTVYKTSGNYNYYAFKMYISQLDTQDLQLALEGSTNNDYGTIDPSVKDAVSTETNNIKNTFTQTLGIKKDKYTIITNFTTNHETKLLIAKITESE
jgi:hypothetical protein